MCRRAALPLLLALCALPLRAQSTPTHFRNPTTSSWSSTAPYLHCVVAPLVGGAAEDLIASDGTSVVWVHETDASGLPGPRVALSSVPSHQIRTVRAADFDGNGLIDVLAAGIETTPGQSGSRVFLSTAVGFLTATPVPNLSSDTTMCLVRDLDGSGTPEILTLGPLNGASQSLEIVGWSSGSFLALNTQALTPAPGTTYRLAPDQALGDLDGDGDLDLLLVESVGTSFSGRVLIARGGSGFGFAAPTPFLLPPLPSGQIGSLEQAWLLDMDYDGRADLITVRSDAQRLLTTLFVASGPSFGAPETLADKSNSLPTIYRIADFTGDYFNDLMGLERTTLAPTGDNSTLELHIGHVYARWSAPLREPITTTTPLIGLTVPDTQPDEDADMDTDVLFVSTVAGSNDQAAVSIVNDAVLRIGCPSPTLAFRPLLWVPRAYPGNATFGVGLWTPPIPTHLSLLGFSTMVNPNVAACAPLISTNLTNGTLFALPVPTNPSGFTFFPVPLPSDSNLRGFQFNVQWGVVDPIIPGEHALTPNRNVIVW